jgi:hypothetical protein
VAASHGGTGRPVGCRQGLTGGRNQGGGSAAFVLTACLVWAQWHSGPGQGKPGPRGSVSRKDLADPPCTVHCHEHQPELAAGAGRARPDDDTPGIPLLKRGGRRTHPYQGARGGSTVLRAEVCKGAGIPGEDVPGAAKPLGCPCIGGRCRRTFCVHLVQQPEVSGAEGQVPEGSESLDGLAGVRRPRLLPGNRRAAVTAGAFPFSSTAGDGLRWFSRRGSRCCSADPPFPVGFLRDDGLGRDAGLRRRSRNGRQSRCSCNPPRRGCPHQGRRGKDAPQPRYAQLQRRAAPFPAGSGPSG